MINVINNYIQDYWLNLNLMDCAKSNAINQGNFQIIITDEELHEINELVDDHLFETNQDENNLDKINKEYLTDNEECINEEKLNNNHKYIISNRDNGCKYKERKNKSNLRFNSSDIPRENTFGKYKFITSGKNVSDNRMFKKQETNKYIRLHNEFNSNQYQRKMYKMPKNSRIYEYGTRERKILLGSQSKPKLI